MKISIFSIIKDEQLYLDEWIKYHLSIGFDDIFLFEDFGSIPHDEICNNYDKVHLIKVEEINAEVPFKGRQFFIVNYFLNNYYTETDWTAIIDLDEFIILDDCSDIHKFLNEYKDDYGLYLYWRIYNANGHIKRPESTISVFDAYTTLSPDKEYDKNWCFKSFVNIKKFHQDNIKMKSVHEVTNGVNTKHLLTSMVRCYHKAHINHYFTKSWEDWIQKIIIRGDIFEGNRKIEDFFKCNPDLSHMKHELCSQYGIQSYYLNKFVILNNEYAVNFMSKCGCSTLGYLAYKQKFKDKEFLTCNETSIKDYEYRHFDDYKNKSNDYHLKIKTCCLEDIKTCKRNKYKTVAIFRDPIQRLISARNPLMSTNKLETNKEFFEFVDEEIKKPIGLTDQHIIPQAYYYNFNDIDIFIELKFLEKWLISIGCEPIKLNQTPKNRYEDATEDIKKWLPTLNEYYKCDYELIDKIKNSDKVWIPSS